MTTQSDFDTVEEVESATALYGQLLCSLIRRLANRQLLDGNDLSALTETIETFRSEDEHLPEVVARHATLLTDFLRALPATGTLFGGSSPTGPIAEPGTDTWHEGP